MKTILTVITVSFLILMNSCNPTTRHLTNGIWRGVFQVSGNEIPFIFDVSGAEKNEPAVTLINGEERFVLQGVTYRNDSVFIPITAYDAVLAGKVSGEQMSGTLIRLYSDKPESRVSFTAQKGNAPRFPITEGNPSVLAGKWEITVPARDSARQVGIFEQKESHLTGSILTITGDYRYLEGVVQGEKFFLSAFSGLSPYLIQGQFVDTDHFTAEFITPNGTTAFEGKRNPDASLPDAYSFTSLKQGYTTVNFTLPDLDGNLVSLSDPKFKDKVVIISILGSWCPNCLDEAAFLAPWYKQNQQRGIEIVGLAFERKEDFAYAQKQLLHLKNQFDITYSILFAGKVGDATVAKVFPELVSFVSYPTTIFLDKKGVVRKIHTGFNGPATGVFYEEFQRDFNQTVDALLHE